ncbi:MAG: hypothetical protein OHK0029_03470 [Armatimonadaceae bacterium]
MPTYHHPLLGAVRFSVLSRKQGTVHLLDRWEEKNLIPVSVPELVGKPLYTPDGAPFRGVLFWHRRGAAQLKAAWAEVAAKGLLDNVRTFDGAFHPRLIRGSRTRLSLHALGIAFDINAPWNPLGEPPAAAGTPGSVRELVPIFIKHGFLWGGHFRSRPDGMHFEIARFTAPLQPTFSEEAPESEAEIFPAQEEVATVSSPV